MPQVLAAAAPMGARAVQIGTLVKLIRVLMLGPVCARPVAGFGEAARRRRRSAAQARRPPLHQLVPWFVIGFLVMAALRSANLIPAPALAPIALTASVFMVVAMAALGLGVDVRTVRGPADR